jgi:hypothetical protein
MWVIRCLKTSVSHKTVQADVDKVLFKLPVSLENGLLNYKGKASLVLPNKAFPFQADYLSAEFDPAVCGLDIHLFEFLHSMVSCTGSHSHIRQRRIYA